MVLLLVPADPLRPRRADGHFAPEAAAARDAGHDVALVDHDALTEPGGAGQAVARVPGGAGPAVYRGWMLASTQYAALADALAAKGTSLRTSAAQYRQAHELPGWYPALAPLTPAAAWTAGDAEQEFHAACARLGPGPAVLRDYVKSMKHYWHQAAYISDTADHAAAWKVAARFRELRGEEFTGGFSCCAGSSSSPPRKPGPGGRAGPTGWSRRTPTPPATCRRTSAWHPSPG